MDRRALAVRVVPVVGLLVLVTGWRTAGATLPPDGGGTEFVRGQAEVAAAGHFAGIDPAISNVACVAPAEDVAGAQMLCYGVNASGQVLTAQATVNDLGGIDITATSGGPAPTVAPTSVPSPVLGSFQGSGGGVVPVDPITGPTIVRVSHDGAGPFVVQPQQGGASVGGPLVDAAGAWTGRYLVGLGGTISAFAVTADGNWTLEVQSRSSALPLSLDVAASGESADVVAYSGDTATPVSFEHSGPGSVVVKAVTASGTEVLVDAAGPFSGDVSLPPGPGFVTIDAAGPWSLAYVVAAPSTTAATTAGTTATTAGTTTAAVAATTTSVP